MSRLAIAIAAGTIFILMGVFATWSELSGQQRGIPGDYQSAKWDPIHFKPAIDTATDAQCLACHQEILTRKVRPASPAGVRSESTLAWYQTLDTYTGDQETFHARHRDTPFAKRVMRLKCNFCHQGHDLREETPYSSATSARSDDFTLRKVVNPSKTCLLCHGRFNYEQMDGVDGPWPEVRGDFEFEDAKNGCLTCHEELFRTVRHRVNYLNAAAIEEDAKQGTSDSCYGCHGGRAWFLNSYPYPRHPWPGMEDVVEETPDWAKDRPTTSDPRHLVGVKQ